MPQLGNKKYPYTEKGVKQYQKDLRKKDHVPQTTRDMSGYKPQTARDMSGYVPQTMRDMNTYTPQTKMTDEQLRQKAFGNAMLKTMHAGKQAADITKMMAQKRIHDIKQESMNQKKAEQIAGAVDGVLAENVQLKKQINLNQIQQKKTDTINQARRKPVNIKEKRTGK